MDRTITYAGQIPLSGQNLLAQQFAYTALGKFINAVMGENSPVSDGFDLTYGSVQGLNVIVGSGSFTANGTTPVDVNGYGSLSSPGVSAGIQYILETSVTVPCPAGATTTIYATGTTGLAGTPVVIPFYNQANPSQTFAGPNNSGTASPTTQKDVATVAYTTGSLPNGSILLYSIIVPAGSTFVSAGMIKAGPTFLAYKLPALQPVLTASGGNMYFRFGPLIIQTFAGPSVDLGAANTQMTTTGYFPVAFPNGCFIVLAIDGASALINWNTSFNYTATSFTIGAWSPIAGSGSNPAAHILAIGY